jgi:hypothetical protein
MWMTDFSDLSTRKTEFSVSRMLCSCVMIGFCNSSCNRLIPETLQTILLRGIQLTCSTLLRFNCENGILIKFLLYMSGAPDA